VRCNISYSVSCSECCSPRCSVICRVNCSESSRCLDECVAVCVAVCVVIYGGKVHFLFNQFARRDNTAIQPLTGLQQTHQQVPTANTYNYLFQRAAIK